VELFEAFKAFPEVARPIVIKSDALRLGLRVSDAARQVCKERDDILFKGYWLFSYDRGEAVMYGDKIPFLFMLEDGTEDGTVVQVRTYANSPYIIDYVDGDFGLYYDLGPSERTHLGKISFDVAPRYYQRTIDGVPMAAVVQANRDMLFVTASKYCEYFSLGRQCLFCDLTPHASSQKKGGEAMVLRKQAERVAEVLDVAFHEPRFRHIFITAGTIVTKHDDMTDVEWWCEFLGTLQKRLKVWYPTSFQVAAQKDEGWRKLRDTGVTSVHPNMEVWDKRLFEIMCPGKSQAVGHEEWVKRTIRAVDFWGPGNVNPSFVLGAEMAQPFGFKTVDEALNSTLGGFDFLMGQGVLPRQGGFWCVEPDSKLAGNEPPPLEYYLRIGLGYLELREKHGFMSPSFILCRYCLNQGTEYDWEYWHGNGPSSRKAEIASGVVTA